MRWKNMSDKCQVLKWQRVTGHGVNSNGKKITVDSADSNRKK